MTWVTTLKTRTTIKEAFVAPPWAYLGESGDLVEILSSILSECGRRTVEARDLLYLREPDARSHEKSVCRHLRKSMRRRGGIKALRAEVRRFIEEDQ